MSLRDFSSTLDALSINTATVRRQRGAEVPLTRIIDQCAAHGIRAISPWRDQVAAVGIDALFLEVHDNPAEALSDGPNMVRIDELEALLKDVLAIDKIVRK